MLSSLRGFIVVGLSALVAAGCASLSAGRQYTLAKVDVRTGGLVEAHRVLDLSDGARDGSGDSGYDEKAPNDTLGIVLNGGFIRYLDAVSRPEVAIFCQVRVRGKTETEETLVWQKVYLNSEKESDHMVLNRNSYLPRRDIVLVPPFQYDGQDVLVSLRVIEMDQKDNAGLIQLVNAAASAGAAFQPESAAGISVFQTVLTFLVKNNADDIEFSYDFAITDSGEPVLGPDIEGKPIKYDVVLSPRVAKYLVLKTEHRDRMSIPGSYFTYAHQSARWGVGKLLEVGTLGFFNWFLYDEADNEGVDPYQWVVGYPLRLPRDAFAIPRFEAGVLGMPGGVDLGIVNSELYWQRTPTYRPPWRWYTEVTPAERKTSLFDAQTYLVFSVVSPESGVDLQALRDATKAQDVVAELGLRTGPLGPEDLKASLESVTNSLQGFALQRRIREKYSKLLAKAKTPEEVARLKAEMEKEVGALQRKFTEQTSAAALESIRSDLEKKVDRRGDRLRRVRFHGTSHFYNDAPEIRLTVDHPENETVTASWHALKGGAPPAAPATLLAQVPGRTQFSLGPQLSLDAECELTIRAATTDNPPKTRQASLKFWVIAKPAFGSAKIGTVDVRNAPWPEGAKAIFVGQNLKNVRAIQVEYEGGRLARFEFKTKDATGKEEFSATSTADISKPVKKLRLIPVPSDLAPIEAWQGD